MKKTLIAALLATASLLAIRQHQLLPIISPMIASLLLLGTGTALRYWQERAAKQAAIDMFGRFLDPIVVQQLAEQGLNAETQASKQCEISVLFSDIRGFTSMSEKASAAEIMALLMSTAIPCDIPKKSPTGTSTLGTSLWSQYIRKIRLR